MGCPQSKAKNKDITNEQAGQRFARNDAVRPEVDYPKSDNKTDERKIAEANADNLKSQNERNERTEDAVNNIGAKGNASKDGNEKTSELTDRIIKNEDSENKTQDKNQQELSSVFIPDDPITGSDVKKIEVNDVFIPETIDVGDVDIGQTVSEITLENDTFDVENSVNQSANNSFASDKEMDISLTKIEGTNVSSVEVNTTDPGHTFTEMSTNWDGPTSVRYVSKEKIEYGLPEGVPKPAPPKNKKNDLITPTTFTIVDKIVENTPDNAFQSVPKLASYLAGSAKKSELIGAGDDDDDVDKKNMPAPVATTTKKCDIVNDVTMFKHIDENARNTPETVRLSVDKLAAHLCSVANSDLEKVRAFYYWVCNNISYVYDKDKTLSDKLRFDAVSTLRQGQGSYVNLVSALCKEASIPVVIIPGCSKGLRHQPDKKFTEGERNHSWNAVYVNNEWRFIDCTWGSGFLDSSGKFNRQFDEFWFLTDPEVYAYDHFPAHQIWQLLDTPITIEEFNKKPSLTEKSRELGFVLKSHREPIIYFENEVSVTFATETYPLSNITADLRDSDGDDLNQHRCMKRLDSNTFEVRIVPPKSGEYSLALFGKAKDYRHAKFRKLMEYTLRCERVYEKEIVFPGHPKTWGPEPNFAELGFAESIQKLSVFKTDQDETSIFLEQTKKIPIIAELKSADDYKTELKGCTMITAQSNGKTIHVRFPSSGFYRLDVYAEGEKTEKYEYAALFMLECTTDTSLSKFPKCNEDSISKHICEIIEPRNLEIPAESKVTFKLRSSGLKNAMLGIPTEEQYGSRMQRVGELKKSGDSFTGEIQTPKAGETLYLSGSAAPPNVFWSRIYEFVTV
ncbi:hypothetical protein ACF0H5_020499 [Mactra antiquata]